MSERKGPAVLAEGLVKHYTGREGTVEAVRGVDLEVRAGEIFGFLGCPTAPASPRPCACSRRCYRSPPVARRSRASTSSATRTPHGTGSESRCRRRASIPARRVASC